MQKLNLMPKFMNPVTIPLLLTVAAAVVGAGFQSKKTNKASEECSRKPSFTTYGTGEEKEHMECLCKMYGPAHVQASLNDLYENVRQAFIAVDKKKMSLWHFPAPENPKFTLISSNQRQIAESECNVELAFRWRSQQYEESILSMKPATTTKGKSTNQELQSEGTSLPQLFIEINMMTISKAITPVDSGLSANMKWEQVCYQVEKNEIWNYYSYPIVHWMHKNAEYRSIKKPTERDASCVSKATLACYAQYLVANELLKTHKEEFEQFIRMRTQCDAVFLGVSPSFEPTIDAKLVSRYPQVYGEPAYYILMYQILTLLKLANPAKTPIQTWHEEKIATLRTSVGLTHEIEDTIYQTIAIQNFEIDAITAFFKRSQ